MGVWVISTFVGSVNGAGKNTGVQVVEHLLSAVGAIPRSGNAGLYADSVLTFLGAGRWLSTVAALYYIPSVCISLLVSLKRVCSGCRPSP